MCFGLGPGRAHILCGAGGAADLRWTPSSAQSSTRRSAAGVRNSAAAWPQTEWTAVQVARAGETGAHLVTAALSEKLVLVWVFSCPGVQRGELLPVAPVPSLENVRIGGVDGLRRSACSGSRENPNPSAISAANPPTRPPARPP